MRKFLDFKLPIRILAVLVCALMIFTCFSVATVYPVTASNGGTAFQLSGSSTYTEIDKECYEVSLSSWANVLTARQVDLTEGLYFTITGFKSNSDWLRIGFNKTTDINDGYISDIKIRYADGTMWCDELKLSGVYYSTPFYSGDMTHFLQARPVKNGDTVTGYQIYLDGKPFNSGGFTISVDDFNNYNNYNAGTGEFDGCHIKLLAIGTPKVCISYPNADRYTGSLDGTFSYIENADGFDDITLGEDGRANATWQFDMLDGVKFTVDGLEENNGDDFVTVGLSNDQWKLRKANFAGNLNPSFRLKNVDGKLAISVFDGTKYGDYYDLKIDVDKNLTLKAAEISQNGELTYKFYLGGKEIKGITMTEEEFYAFNYNFGGIYVGFSAKKGAKLKNVCKAVLGENPFTEQMNFSSVNKNGSYDMKIGGQGSAVSNWQADLTKGIIFNLDDITSDDGADWVHIAFLADSKNTQDVYNEGILLKWHNGQLYGALSDTRSVWKISYFGTFGGNHLLKAKAVNVDGATVYRVTIDGKNFGNNFDITEADFQKINNYNNVDGTFEGAHFKFKANTGARISVFVPGDAAFTGEDGFSYTVSSDEKYNLTLEKDAYAISTWQVELMEGIAFNVEEFKGVVSLRFANNLWLMSREDGIPTKNCQPLIKIKEENGALYACVSNDDTNENYLLLNGVSVGGEHILNAKKSVLEGSGKTVYRLYIDNVEIDNTYYLSAEDFQLINNYESSTDSFLGATVRFAATEKVQINNIYKATDFEGTGFTYSEVTDGHYDLNIKSYSYAISKWKADLTQGVSFTVDNIKGWIMIRFSSSFEKMYTGMPGTETNTYQPLMLIRNDEDGIYVAMMSGFIHKSGTKLKGVSLLGTHILTAKLAPDVTGVMCYRFYLDGMPICTGYTMSQSVMKKINGYNKETDTFDGTHIFFGSQNGVTINDVHRLTVGETVKNDIWDTATKAGVAKVDDSTYSMELPAFSSLRSGSAVDMEKGVTMNAQNGVDFGIALSMLPGGTTLDVPPVITDTNGIYYSFKKTDTNMYRIVSSSGLVADYSGDLSGSHIYSMVKITDSNGQEKYTLAIDGKAVFNDGMEKNDYIKFSNGSSGSYPTVFARTDDKIQVSGTFKKVDSINTDNLWDDDWDGGTDDWLDEEEDSSFEDEWTDDWSDDWDDFEEEESEATTKRVLIKRVKIPQEPIITYEMNWWLVVIAVAAVALVVVGVITFVPFKKKDEKQENKEI